MNRSNVDKAYEHVVGICRNYPEWPVTFGKCSTEGCRKFGRGSGMCADCHEKELAKYCGEEAAKNFHDSVKAKNMAYINLVNEIRIKDNE